MQYIAPRPSFSFFVKFLLNSYHFSSKVEKKNNITFSLFVQLTLSVLVFCSKFQSLPVAKPTGSKRRTLNTIIVVLIQISVHTHCVYNHKKNTHKKKTQKNKQTKTTLSERFQNLIEKS